MAASSTHTAALCRTTPASSPQLQCNTLSEACCNPWQIVQPTCCNRPPCCAHNVATCASTGSGASSSRWLMCSKLAQHIWQRTVAMMQSACRAGFSREIHNKAKVRCRHVAAPARGISRWHPRTEMLPSTQAGGRVKHTLEYLLCSCGWQVDNALSLSMCSNWRASAPTGLNTQGRS